MGRIGIIISVLLTLGSDRCSSQIDRTFPNELGSWVIRVDQHDPWYNWYSTTHEIIYIHTPQVQLEGRSWGSVFVLGDDPVGLIAVDSGKVLYRSIAPYVYADGGYDYFDTIAQVLYDFNLVLGDTAYEEQEPITVISVDTMALWGQARKHLVLSNEDEWIEGVGSIHGLFRPYAATWGLEAISYTMLDFCGWYIDQDSLPYAMCLPDAIGEHGRTAISVAPNPSAGSFTIRSGQPNGTFRIRNMSGSILHIGMLTGKETQVDVPHLAPGVYLVQTDELCVKLVVQ